MTATKIVQNIYAKIMEIDTKQHTGNVREFLKHWSRNEITVEEDGLSIGEIMDAVMEISRSSINALSLPFVKRTFLSVEERFFRTFVTEPLGSVNDCYEGQVIGDGHSDLLGAPTDRYAIMKR